MTASDIDARILEVLVTDGRIPIRTLAERLDLPETTVRDHLHRLKEDGVIRGYRARVDLDHTGIRQTTWLLASIADVPRDLAAQLLDQDPQVMAVRPVASHPHRLFIHVASLPDASLLDFVENAERRFGMHVKGILPVARVLRPADDESLPDLP